VLVTQHPELPGKHQLRILPEHGPGAVARTARQRLSTRWATGGPATFSEVEVRDLGIYDALGAAEMAS
jgi:hypothetical protein